MHSEDDNVAFIARLRAGSLDQLADRLQDEWDNGFQVAAVTWGDLRALADLPSSACGPVEQPDRDALIRISAIALNGHVERHAMIRWDIAAERVIDALLARYDIRERGETA